jgi:Domain of Unknown Function with PDB structure (DUF3857)
LRISCAGTAIALLLLFPHLNGFGQTADAWPPVPPADLELKDNPARPDSPAMLLERDSEQDDVHGVLSEYFRIKVFKDEGRKYANIEIPYLEKVQEVRDIRARTIRPDGTALEFKGEVLDQLLAKSKRLRYQAKVIHLSDVGPGSIIEYSYKFAWHRHVPDVLKNPAGFLIDGTYSFPTARWMLQHELFTRHARFRLRYLPKANLQWTLVRPPQNAAVQRKGDGTAELEVHDVPPLEKEEFLPPEDLINSRVHFFYMLGFAAPSQFWRDEAKRQGKEIDKFIGHSKTIEHALGGIILPQDPPETKVQKIYACVQQLRYLSYESRKSGQENKRESIKANKNVEEVWERGYASTNEINYLFVALLRAAGFSATITQLASRSHSILDPQVPDATQLNATVVVVRVGDKDLFLDPATRFCPYGLLPWEETGVHALQLGDVWNDFLRIPGRGSDTAITKRTATAKLLPDGTLEGVVHVTYSGQEALRKRLSLYDEDEGGRRKALEEEIKQWLPASAIVEIKKDEPWESSEEDLRVESSFTVPEFATINGRRLMFPLALFQSNETNPFKSDKRAYPVYFDFAYQTEDDIQWTFPEGFQPEALPKPHTYQNNFFHYQSRLTPEFKFKRSTQLEGFIFDPGMYTLIKRCYEQMITDDHSSTIVLQQAPSKP